jgi:hypothetical protein
LPTARLRVARAAASARVRGHARGERLHRIFAWLEVLHAEAPLG